MMKAIEVKALSAYRIGLKYTDGVTGEVDLGHLAGRGYSKVRADRKVFEGVHVDQSGAIAWSENIDLRPDACYLRLTGKAVDELFPKLKQIPVDA